MWYFAWILGVLLACACGIINVMWLEFEHKFDQDDDTGENTASSGDRSGSI
jgi:cyd operon protein YbgT